MDKEQVVYTPNKERAVFEMLFPELKGCLWKDIPDLFSWEGFGVLWGAAQKAEWWGLFLKWIWVHEDQAYLATMNIGLKFINPETFISLLYEWGIASGRIKEDKEDV